MLKSSIAFYTIIIFSLLLCAGSGAQQVTESEEPPANGAAYLLLNEISPFTEPGGSPGPWVELINPTDTTVSLDGWSVLFLSGWEIQLETLSQECPPGGIVVITTGSAMNLSNMDETVTVIDGGSIAQLDPDGDGCVLIGPLGAVDAISWGHNPPRQYNEIPSGPPLVPLRGFYTEGSSIHDPGDVLIRRQISLIGADVVGSGHWDYRPKNAESPGEPNPPPPPVRYSPSDGAEIASDFNLYVAGFDWTTHTTFQLSRDPGFAGIEIETMKPLWKGIPCRSTR
jgi:hypothetical protein